MKEYLSSAEEVLQEQNSSPEGFQSGSGETAGAVRPQQAEGGEKGFPAETVPGRAGGSHDYHSAGAAAVSGVTAFIEGESFADVIIILIVVIINAVLGVFQESKAEAAIAALQEIAAATSKVMRDGKMVILKSEDLVPGDVVILEAGDAVPADGRIIECASMKIEEAALTGESVPVNKLVKVLNLDGRRIFPWATGKT